MTASKLSDVIIICHLMRVLYVCVCPTGRVPSSTVRDCSSAASRVCDRCWQLSLHPIDITWERDSEHTYHLSVGNLLVGSTCVRGSTFGDSQLRGHPFMTSARRGRGSGQCGRGGQAHVEVHTEN